MGTIFLVYHLLPTQFAEVKPCGGVSGAITFIILANAIIQFWSTIVHLVARAQMGNSLAQRDPLPNASQQQLVHPFTNILATVWQAISNRSKRQVQIFYLWFNVRFNVRFKFQRQVQIFNVRFNVRSKYSMSGSTSGSTYMIEKRGLRDAV